MSPSSSTTSEQEDKGKNSSNFKRGFFPGKRRVRKNSPNYKKNLAKNISGHFSSCTKKREGGEEITAMDAAKARRKRERERKSERKREKERETTFTFPEKRERWSIGAPRSYLSSRVD